MAAFDRFDGSVDRSIGSINSIDSISDRCETSATRVLDDLQLSISPRRFFFLQNVRIDKSVFSLKAGPNQVRVLVEVLRFPRCPLGGPGAEPRSRTVGTVGRTSVVKFFQLFSRSSLPL